ncbi:hypothetical protein DFJ77DRAFT_444301, partial [Powellomyces hirtus]
VRWTEVWKTKGQEVGGRKGPPAGYDLRLYSSPGSPKGYASIESRGWADQPRVREFVDNERQDAFNLLVVLDPPTEGHDLSWSAGPGGNHLGQGRLRLARTLVLFLLVAVAPQVPVYGTATPSSGGSGSTHVGPLEPGSTDHGDKRTPKVVYELLNCKQQLYYYYSFLYLLYYLFGFTIDHGWLDPPPRETMDNLPAVTLLSPWCYQIILLDDSLVCRHHPWVSTQKNSGDWAISRSGRSARKPKPTAGGAELLMVLSPAAAGDPAQLAGHDQIMGYLKNNVVWLILVYLITSGRAAVRRIWFGLI